MKHDPAMYRVVSKSLDGLFKTHGDKAGTCIRRYLRIKSETESATRQISDLEAQDELYQDYLEKLLDTTRRLEKGRHACS